MTTDTAAFVYARCDSSRLPGKILREIAGHTVIDIVHARAARVAVDRVVVLTTDREVDDPLAAHCAQRGYLCFRGDPEDLVRRTLQAIEVYAPAAILRVNGDSPLFDPALANAALARLDNGTEMVSNIVERSFPYGIAVEWIATDAYVRLADAAEPQEREHVTQHLYRLRGALSLCSMTDTGGNHADLRLTLDTQQDWDALSRLCSGRDVTKVPYWRLCGIAEPTPAFRPAP
ncbi:cytidylyltransferase domain-containing protein [Rhodovulum adriaticum]|uniref:Spore coat polysaccharide biosynthesis protein SpsF n=1 Tax=Rhodovulum adriaticum TaxID=35804 RepID=A0A4R2NY82_RHOAD|nr:NTP transferase domain-containing protein [Rhodovulum adriaticum]MBK1634226.1 hypothetical protein [Rhodovulum adriaticum]TCP27223.1 spore coat polysaccharide biosynthesis protein SpsF [Rhodovulum adriaticum]